MCERTSDQEKKREISSILSGDLCAKNREVNLYVRRFLVAYFRSAKCAGPAEDSKGERRFGGMFANGFLTVKSRSLGGVNQKVRGVRELRIHPAKATSISDTVAGDSDFAKHLSAV